MTRDWQRALRECVMLKTAHIEDITWLTALPATVPDDDYAASAFYQRITGRAGQWYYGCRTSAGLVCLHPNRPERLLIFPPRGVPELTMLPKLLRTLPVMPDGIQLARFSAASLTTVAQCNLGSRYIVPQAEDILDWRYPCHILDTAMITAGTGAALAEMRRDLRKSASAQLTAVPLDRARHGAGCAAIAEQWAMAKTALCAPQSALNFYQALLEAWQNTPELDGQALLTPRGLAGFTLWEPPKYLGSAAIYHAGLSDAGTKGATAFGIQSMCRSLQARGIATVNIGGSETRNLDWFKRKFAPVRSYQLFSADLVS